MNENAPAETSAEVDIDSLFEQVLTVMRDAQRANWDAAWKLGSLLDDHLDDDNAYGRSIAKALVQKLKDHGMDIALSSLYAYRQIFIAYNSEDIPGLLANGVTQSHAQLLAALEPSLRQQVEERMYLPDGRCIATRELKSLLVLCARKLRGRIPSYCRPVPSSPRTTDAVG